MCSLVLGDPWLIAPFMTGFPKNHILGVTLDLMSTPTSFPKSVVVFACRVFQNWLERMLPEGLTNDVTFFDYALHSIPKKLRQTLQSAIDSVERPSLILLGYGLCGNGLDGIEAREHTLVIPRTDDCIAIILGSYQAYRREFDRESATYYLSKGWLEGGSTPLEEYEKYAGKYGADKAAWLMDYQYHNYQRLALIARNDEELQMYRPRAQEVARYCERWEMRYDELVGTDDMLVRLIKIAAGLDAANVDDEFVIVPPGGVLKQSQFLR